MEKFREEKFSKDDFRDQTISNKKFYCCDFSDCDLTDTIFDNCFFYDEENQTGCDFSGAKMKDASFRKCDLTMNNFQSIDAIGLEIKDCKAIGANFQSANFMNRISSRSWFCIAYITGSDLSYANFSSVVLEKCELWDNRWSYTTVKSSNFCGSDLSGGDFTHFDWPSSNVTYCNLTDSILGDLDMRIINLEGAALDSEQILQLAASVGINVIP